MIKTIVVSNQKLGESQYLLSLEKRRAFLPGQVVGLILGSLAPRLYSIASGTEDSLLKILYTIKPEGELTPLLAQLKPGDEISHTEARGSFLNTQHKAYWIASGTGIAPFVSMAKSDPHFSNYVLGLFHTSRACSHFEANFFSEALGPRYKRYCTRQKPDSPEIKEGRFTQDLLLAQDLDLEAEFYLCGAASMVVELRDLLITKGVSYAKIKSEIYF